MQKEKVVHTQCHICEQMCGLEVKSVDGRITEINPDKQNPYSWRDFCVSGSSSHEVQSHPNRLRSPMRRVGDGKYVEASYEEAIADIAGRLKKLIAESGPDCVADYLGNPGALSSYDAQFNNAFFGALGTRNRYFVGSIDHNAHLLVGREMYGSPTTTLQTDLDRCECLLLVGSNPAVSGMNWLGRIPDGWRRILKRVEAGMDLIIVDPRRTESAKHATLHVAALPESDWALLLGLHHVILSEGWENAADCAASTHYAEFRELVLSANLDDLAARCDVPAATIRDVARRFATVPSSVCMARTGSAQGRNGAITEWLAQALNVVTGRIDKPGGRYLPTFPLNLMALSVKPANVAPSRVRGLPPVEGTYPLATLSDEILTPGKGKVRALFINGGNPVVTGPDGARLDRALASLDLLVGIDLFQRESHRHAHWLIPGVHFLERDEVNVGLHSMNSDAFVMATRQAVPPPPGVKPEWEFFRDLAAALDLPLFGGKMEPHPHAVVRGMLQLGGQRITLEEILDAGHGVYRGQQEFGHFHSSLKTTDGRIELYPPSFAVELKKRLAEAPARDGRLCIITRRSRYMMNSWLAESAVRKDKHNRSQSMELSIADAKALGLGDGDQVDVTSDVATVTMSLRVSSEIRPGVAVLDHGWGGGLYDPVSGALVSRTGVNRNLLVNADDLDPLTGVPALNGTRVSVRKATPAPQAA